MTFGMAIARRPMSIYASGKEKFKAALQAEAHSRFLGGTMLDGALYIRIIWFHGDKTTGDIDNVMKPVRDALTGVVYLDDFLIVKSLSERVDTTQSFTLAERTPSIAAYDDLLRLLSENHPHIMYVEVGQLQSRRVVFGPIDGDHI